MDDKEIIYRHSWGGKWWKRLLCLDCHYWRTLKRFEHNGVIFLQEECIDCGIKQNMLIVDWNKGRGERNGINTISK